MNRRPLTPSHIQVIAGRRSAGLAGYLNSINVRPYGWVWPGVCPCWLLEWLSLY
jgi:hypothetical protein